MIVTVLDIFLLKLGIQRKLADSIKKAYIIEYFTDAVRKSEFIIFD